MTTKMRLTSETYEFLQEKAHEGNYTPRQLSQFINDLCRADLYADPSQAQYQLKHVYKGKMYRFELSLTSLEALDEVAMCSGLTAGVPELVLTNIHSGYIKPIAWPDAMQALTDFNASFPHVNILSGLPIPSTMPLHLKSHAPTSPDFAEVPERYTLGMFLVTPWGHQITKQFVEDLPDIYSNQYIDTRPALVREQHEAMQRVGMHTTWEAIDPQTENLRRPLPYEKHRFWIRVESSVIEHLSKIADTFGIHGSRQDTPNAKAAAVINAILIGWLSPADTL